LLAALEDQDNPRDRMEVIVVADGCTDDTHEVLGQYRGPLSVRLIQQPNQGPAAARNAGATSAKGECLLFLDDDVVPNPRLVSAHLRAHQRSPGGVVIGPYPPSHLGAGLLDLAVQAWWRNVFEELLKVGCRHSFASVLTGNLSLSADLFRRLGGFDTRFRAHEDYEFGMRLIKADIMIVHEPEALALHHYQSYLAAHIERKMDEGRGDVMLLERYPELATELPLYRLMRSPAWQDRMIRTLALHRVPLTGMLRRLLLGLLDSLDAAGLSGAWGMLKGLLERYAYLHAVADQLGGVRPVIDFCRSLGSQRFQGGLRVELDLSHGIAEAERQVDLVRPSGARVRYRLDLIGVIPWRPGAERLRGVHLRAALARELAAPFLEAMARDGAIAGDSEEQRRSLCEAIRRQRYWVGPVRFGEMWFEQYGQWQRFEGRETEGDRKTRRFWDLFTSLARELDWLDDEIKQARPRAIAEDAVR
jgi:glycosyltransferase involved in cell wall biosynthesis